MIQIIINTENEKLDVSISEIKNGSQVGEQLSFESLNEAKSVTLLDIFKHWREICILNNAPFGSLLTGKRMLQENISARMEQEFRTRLREYMADETNSEAISVKTEMGVSVTEEKLKHYNKFGNCPDCHGKLTHSFNEKIGKHVHTCAVCASGFVVNVPTFRNKAIAVYRVI